MMLKRWFSPKAFRATLFLLSIVIGCSAPHSGRGLEASRSTSEAVSFAGVGDPAKVTPALSCVTNDLAAGHWIAVFTATNTTSATIVVPIGSTNRVTPAPLGANPPTAFSPGKQYFSLGFAAGNPITWTLGTRTVTASTDSQACTIATGPLGPVARFSNIDVPVRLDPSTVLANAVVPTETDASGTTEGASPGSFSVTQDGAASYVVNLWSPPGRGVHPNLALVYGSRFGTSNVGVGWQLSGLSQIARCTRTAAQDVHPSPVDFRPTGAICLDGHRLVRVAENEFRPENDNFKKVVTDSALSSFTVFERDGRVLTYGASSGKLSGTKRDWNDDSPIPWTTEPATYAWALDSVKDRVGNEMTIEYETRSSQAPRFVELLPRTIRYSPGRRVEIRYDDDPDAVQGDGLHPTPAYRFVSGFGLASTRVITRIRMFGPDPVGSMLLREYRLTYKMKANLTERPLLTSVQECDRSGVCLAPTTFGWQEGTRSFDDIPLANAPVPHFDATSSFLVRSGFIGLSVLDLDGDGRDDIDLWGLNSTVGQPDPNGYRLSVRHGAFAPPVANPPVQVGVAPGIRAVDLRMRGQHEMMVENGIGGVNVFRLNLATHALDNVLTTLSPEFVADLNGDALSDLLDGDDAGGPIRYRLNIGSDAFSAFGFATESVFVTDPPPPHTESRTYLSDQSSPSYVADFDATGRNAIAFRNRLDFGPAVNDHLLRIMHLDTDVEPGSPGFPAPTADVHTKLTPLPSADKLATGFHYFFVDINGDGNADAIRVPNAGGPPELAVNNGANFEDLVLQAQLPPADSIAGSTGVADGYAPGIQIADVNEDGIPDLLLLGARSGPHAYISTPDLGLRDVPLVDAIGRTLPTADANGGSDLSDSDGFPFSQVLDANGDGLMDFVQPVNGQLHLFLHSGIQADQITSITEGQGKAYTVDYRSMQGDGVDGNPLYAPDDCTYPQFCTRRGMWLVAQYTVTADNDVNVNSRTHSMSYEYAGAQTDLRGRGFIAMGSRREVDEQTGTAVVTIADTSSSDIATSPYPLAGLIRKEIVTAPLDAAAQLYRVVVTTSDYDVTSEPGSTQAPPQPPYNARPTKVVRTVTDTTLTSDFDSSSDTVDIVRTIKGGLRAPYVFAVSSKQLSRVTIDFESYDEFNNLTARRTTTETSGGNEVNLFQATYANQTGDSIDPTAFILGMPSSSQVTSTTPARGSKTRTTSYVPNVHTGLIDGMTVQPDSPSAEEVVTVAYARNAFGQVVSTTSSATDPLDRSAMTRVETVGYDDGDGVFPSSVTNAAGHTTRMLYHPGLGVIGFQLDPNQVKTTSQYDGFGRLRSSTTDGRGPTTMSYHKVTFPTSVVQGGIAVHAEQTGGESATTLYNELGHPFLTHARSSEPNDSAVETRYTGVRNGEIASVTRPFFADTAGSIHPRTTYTYDPLGRPLTTTLPNGSVTGYTYDGLRQTVMDPKRNTVDTLTDALGRIVTVSEALVVSQAVPALTVEAVQTDYAYGPFDDVEEIKISDVQKTIAVPGTVTTPVRTTSMTYDDLGRRKRLDDPDSGVSERTFNAFGEVVREQQGDPTRIPSNQVETIVYTRDAIGRVVSEAPSSQGPNTFQWDTAPFGIGRLASSTSPDGIVRGYSYNSSGFLTDEAWTIPNTTPVGAAPPPTTYHVNYTYDPFGRLDLLQYPTVPNRSNRFGVNYHYDARGVADAVCKVDQPPGLPALPCDPASTTAPPLWRADARQADGQLTQETFANGEVTKRQYVDSRGFLTNIDTTKGTTKNQSLGYGYDSNGNLQTRTSNIGGMVTETFTYDALNRLINVTGIGSSTFDYDVVGNLRARVNKDALGQISSRLDYSFAPGASGHSDLVVSGTTYSFDGKGRNTRVGTSFFAQRQVDYTSFDLPKRVTVDEGSQVFSFLYDADHRRVSKTFTSTQTTYVGELYERHNRDQDGFVRHLFYVPSPERIVAEFEIRDDGTQKFLYMHDDLLGSIDTVGKQDGTVDQRFSYDVFGARNQKSNDVHMGFTYQEQDDDITEHFPGDPGLVNMKGRVYDPKIARFMTADPLVSSPFASQGHNRYAYAFNNPLANTDPSGFDCMGNCPTGPGPGSGGPGPGSDSGWSLAYGENGWYLREAPTPTSSGSVTLPPTTITGTVPGPSEELMKAIQLAVFRDTPLSSDSGPAATSPMSDGNGSTPRDAGGSGQSESGGVAPPPGGPPPAGGPTPGMIGQPQRTIGPSGSGGYTIPNPWWEDQIIQHPVRSWAVATVAGTAAVVAAAEVAAATTIKTLGGAVSGAISGAVSGKDASGIARGAGIGAVIGAINPFGPVGGALASSLNSMAANAAGQGLNSAVTGSGISISAVFAAGVGRGIFGAASGGFSPSGLVETVMFQSAAGVSSGLISGSVAAAHFP